MELDGGGAAVPPMVGSEYGIERLTARLDGAARLAVGRVSAAMAVLAGLAWLSGAYAVVSALGPSLLLAAVRPRARESAATSVVAAHGVAIVCGLVALSLCGLLGAPASLDGALSLARAVAITLATALTAGAMFALDRFHAPAASMALVVALGVVSDAASLCRLGIAVLVTGAIVAGLTRSARRRGEA